MITTEQAYLTIENEKIRLNVEKGTGNVEMLDKLTGKVWSSCKSPAIVHYFEKWRGETGRRCVAAFPGEKWHTAVKSVGEESIEATFHHNGTGIGFAFRISLDGNSARVTIPVDSIREDKSWLFTLSKIEVYPCFGAVSQGQDGYLVLPNDGGMLIYFSPEEADDSLALTEEQAQDVHTSEAVRQLFRKDTQAPIEHASKIYSEQANVEDLPNMPFYGVVHGGSAYSVIVTSGQYDAEIKLLARQGPEKTFSLHPVFCYRESPIDNMGPVDRSFKVSLIDPDKADYSGIAGSYRDYLLEEGGLPSFADRVQSNAQLDKLGRSICIDVMLGHKRYFGSTIYPYDKQDGKGEMVVFLTYSEVRKLIGKLHESGVADAYIKLIGINREGHDGLYPTIFPLETCFGPVDELEPLIAEAKSYGYLINVHVNYRDGYEASPDYAEGIGMKDRFGTLRRGGFWPGGQSVCVCPEVALDRFARRDIPKLKELGFDGPIYFDNIQGVLDTCHDKRHPLDRKGYAEAVKAYVAYGKSVFGIASTEMAMSDMLDTVDLAYNIPYAKGRSDYTKQTTLRACGLMGEGIPLAFIVYHGIVACASHITDERDLLKAIECGTLPYRDWRSDAFLNDPDLDMRCYEICCRELGYLQQFFIERHAEVAGGITETVFSNGDRVVVNYSDTEFVSEWGPIMPQTHLLVKERRRGSEQ